MVISNTSAVDVSIQAVSPLLILSTPTSCGDVGAGGAAAGAAAAAGAPASAFAGSALLSAAAGAGAVAAGGVVAALLSCANTAPPAQSAPTTASNANDCFMMFPLERIGTGLAGPDAHDLFELENEDLPVADLAGVGGFFDRLDHPVEQVAFDRGLDLDLGQEVDDVFGAAIELGVSFLPPEALDLGDGDALHADRGQGLPDLVQLERLDDRGDQFHGLPLGECARCGASNQNVFCRNTVPVALPMLRPASV